MTKKAAMNKNSESAALLPTDDWDNIIREMQRAIDESLAGSDSQIFQQEIGIFRQILEEGIEGFSNLKIEDPRLRQLQQETLAGLQLLRQATIPRHEINPEPQ